MLERKLLYETKLEAAYTALDGGITPHESYRFDSGEGSQQVKQRKLKEIQDYIDGLEARLRWICDRLNGQGIFNLSLRRRRCGY